MKNRGDRNESNSNPTQTYTLHRLKTSSTLSPSCQDETTNLLFRISTCLSDESTSKHCLKTSPSMIRFRSFQLVPNPNSNSLSSLPSSLSQDSTLKTSKHTLNLDRVSMSSCTPHSNVSLNFYRRSFLLVQDTMYLQ